MNSNWSYSPETVKLGVDLCDIDLWPLTLTSRMQRIRDQFAKQKCIHTTSSFALHFQVCSMQMHIRLAVFMSFTLKSIMVTIHVWMKGVITHTLQHVGWQFIVEFLYLIPFAKLLMKQWEAMLHFHHSCYNAVQHNIDRNIEMTIVNFILRASYVCVIYFWAFWKPCYNGAAPCRPRYSEWYPIYDGRLGDRCW